MTIKYKRPESVLVVLYDENSQVLILQRKDDPNFWQSVTGSLEEGELPAQTAHREVLEETGIDLAPSDDVDSALIDCRTINQYQIRPEWQHRYPPNDCVNTEYVFCAKILRNSNIKLTEHLTFKWLSKSEAIDRVWSDSNKKAIQAFVPDA